MTAGLSAAISSKPFLSLLSSHHGSNTTPVFNPSIHHQNITYGARRKTSLLSVCFVSDEQKHSEPRIVEEGSEHVGNIDPRILIPEHVAEKLARKRSERFTYLVAAVMSSFGITSMAVYYRFSWQMEVPLSEMFGTFALSVGLLWAWSFGLDGHTELSGMLPCGTCTREGAFELNDVFAVINAVPAIALLSFGFFNKGLLPGLCFGAGLGITVFGMAYMLVHDSLVHKRFPVGPITNVPYLRKVACCGSPAPSF